MAPETSHLAPIPPEPEELSSKELTRHVRALVAAHLDLHTRVHALNQFVREDHVVPELNDLDDRMDNVEETQKAFRSGLDALRTITHATGQQMAAIARHLGVPVHKDLSE